MIRFDKVSFKYNEEKKNEIKALSDVNIEIDDGQVIVITGESGCGKTTVVRLINGLSPKFYGGQFEGSVSVEGEDPTSQELYETAKVVGSVFQNPRSQFFNVDTTSEITFSCVNQGLDKMVIKERLAHVTDEFKIQNLLDRSIFDLSGGQKQKIACASIAMSDSKVIVMDEPSSNLDLQSINDLKSIIEKWKLEGRTIVIAEHRLYYLKELADRVFVMRDGKLDFVMEKEELEKLTVDEMRKLGLRTFSIEEVFRQKLTDRGESAVTGKPMNKALRDIRVSKMKFSYGKKGDGIDIENLNLKSGEITALIGPNGAGKTTFAKCLCGINKKCKDRITENSKRLKKDDRIRESFMVMQDVNTQLFADSVLNEVMLSLREKYKGVFDVDACRQEGLKILKMMDLTEVKDRHPISLSGGQKQRVAIAGAVAADKQVIIFDEPTSGLDYKHMVEVSELMKLLANMGKIILVITHDMELVLSTMDNVICMKKGEITDCYKLNDDSKQKLYRFLKINQ
ncbi:MAG: energy-coupling factor ABC transporter ATP-binding protein [Lachnospiraceae bacterium]|nr:energy-coupling factor ABC transporter ATP-binding protein [Lachnospiraceae bacterium]